LLNCTVSGNSSISAGGIFISGGTTHVRNSIIAGNDIQNVSGTLTTDDHNVLSGDPKLGPLQDNGGPTPTMALLFGSPAIDAGNDAVAPATDQRGVTRPGGTTTDIGAFEVQATYGISGYIRVGNVTPVSGVSVQLSTASGPAGSPVTTDANGFYQFTKVPPDGYLVTPSLSGWSFSPTAQSIVVSSANRAANFTATRNAAAYSISGRLSDSSGAALPGQSVSIAPVGSGVPATVVTNSAGYYTFSGVVDGTYTVTPSNLDVTYAPSSRSVVVSGGNATGQNFIGSTGYTLIGRISDATGAAIAGATVMIPGVGTATTNSAGYYTFTNVPNGTYTLTPSLASYVFSPASRNVTVSGANQSGLNFIGSTGYTVSGRIATSAGIAITGVTVTIDGGATVTSNSAGYYTFYNVANGSHTLVPSKSGTAFVPATKTVTVNGANVSGQNFVGS
jgi:hypothetical protein